MKKIISLFKRNYETDKLVRNEVVPGAEWVLQGEGTARWHILHGAHRRLFQAF